MTVDAYVRTVYGTQARLNFDDVQVTTREVNVAGAETAKVVRMSYRTRSDSGGVPIRESVVVAKRNDTIYTLHLIAPRETYDEDVFIRASKSFELR